jgi:hypothetical protein
MPLRCKHEILHKLGVAIKRSDAIYDVSVVELKALISDDELPASEWRTPRQFVVNYVVQLFDCMI